MEYEGEAKKMGNNKALEVLPHLKHMVTEMNEAQHEEEIKKIETEFLISTYELQELYTKLQDFQKDIRKIGGVIGYEKENITWLKSELELLFLTYQFCQKYGMKVADISSYLSKGKLGFFSKTSSQMQNTYYKLKSGEMLFETTMKQKPGRKRKQAEEMKVASKAKVKKTPKGNKQKNLVAVLSGIVENFRVIDVEHDKKDVQLEQLMEGIYHLSTIAVTRKHDDSDIKQLKREISALRSENERLKQEKAELLLEMKDVTNDIVHFITSSDADQIRTLPSFLDGCKGNLQKLGLYNSGSEANMELVVETRGQVVSMS